MCIVLDNVVNSCPIIQSALIGGSGEKKTIPLAARHSSPRRCMRPKNVSGRNQFVARCEPKCRIRWLTLRSPDSWESDT